MSEIERLQRYEKLVQFIANDYHELSYDKAKRQRDDWKRRCKELIQTDRLDDLLFGNETTPNDDLDF